MKGITPVIAIILLLLITISMVGFAFIWFQRVQGTITNETETQLNNQFNQQAQKISIDNAHLTQVVIRNIGTATIQGSAISVYLGGVVQTSPCSGSVAPGATITCTITSCSVGQAVKATSPGNTDEVLCE